MQKGFIISSRNIGINLEQFYLYIDQNFIDSEIKVELSKKEMEILTAIDIKKKLQKSNFFRKKIEV